MLSLDARSRLALKLFCCFSQETVAGAPLHTTQATLVELLLSIKALPMDTIVDKLSVVMKKPPNTNHQTSARVRGLFLTLYHLHVNLLKKNLLCELYITGGFSV